MSFILAELFSVSLSLPQSQHRGLFPLQIPSVLWKSDHKPSSASFAKRPLFKTVRLTEPWRPENFPLKGQAAPWCDQSQLLSTSLPRGMRWVAWGCGAPLGCGWGLSLERRRSPHCCSPQRPSWPEGPLSPGCIPFLQRLRDSPLSILGCVLPSQPEKG